MSVIAVVLTWVHSCQDGLLPLTIKQTVYFSHAGEKSLVVRMVHEFLLGEFLQLALQVGQGGHGQFSEKGVGHIISRRIPLLNSDDPLLSFTTCQNSGRSGSILQPKSHKVKRPSKTSFPVFDPVSEVQSSLSLLKDLQKPCEKQVQSYKVAFNNPYFTKYIAWFLGSKCNIQCS